MRTSSRILLKYFRNTFNTPHFYRAMERRLWLGTMILFSLLGMLISGYDMMHPWGEEDSFCDFSSRWSCSAVNTCRWARLFNIKVAAYGLVVYSSLFLGGLFLLLRGMEPLVRNLLALVSVGGFIFSLYLTGIELFVLKMLCPTCVISQLSIAMILLSAFNLYGGERRKALLARARTPGGILTILAALVICLLLVHGAYALCGVLHPDGAVRQQGASLDDFARCLADGGVTMYGSMYCGHCKEQKEMFGESWQYANYVECSIEGQPELQAEACRAAGISAYPSWVFPDGSTIVGRAQLPIIAAKSGCDLPDDYFADG